MNSWIPVGIMFGILTFVYFVTRKYPKIKWDTTQKIFFVLFATLHAIDLTQTYFAICRWGIFREANPFFQDLNILTMVLGKILVVLSYYVIFKRTIPVKNWFYRLYLFLFFAIVIATVLNNEIWLHLFVYQNI